LENDRRIKPGAFPPKLSSYRIAGESPPPASSSYPYLEAYFEGLSTPGPFQALDLCTAIAKGGLLTDLRIGRSDTGLYQACSKCIRTSKGL